MPIDHWRLRGAKAKADYYDDETWEVFLREGDVIDQAAADRLAALGLVEVEAALHGKDENVGEAEEDDTIIVPDVQKWQGWGSYRSAVARVSVIKPGTGEIRVNSRPVWVYFAKTHRDGQKFLERLLTMPKVKNLLSEFEVVADVRRSCETCKQQAHAVAHGLAQALWAYDGKLREPLEKAGYGKCKMEKRKRFEEG